MRSKDFISTRDDVALHVHDWSSIEGTLRGTIVLVHGLGEHLGRYGHLAARLNARQWRVIGCDLRGHGRSQGARGDAPQRDALLEDLALVIDAARADAPAGTPLVLLGHSLGGLIAARFVAATQVGARPAWARDVDALALSSPALDPGLRPAQRALLSLARHLFPHLAVGNGLDPQWVSRDEQVVAAYVADPLVHDRVTATVARFAAEAGAEVMAAAPRWRMPTLLMWAGADRCVAPAGSVAFAAAAPRSVLEAQPWPGLSHELFNEPEREQVIDRLLDWLNARFG